MKAEGDTGSYFLVLQEGAQLSCRPTVAECHKTLPFKMETDSGINSHPSPPFPSIGLCICIVQMLFVSAFVFDAALCVRPLTPLQPHMDLRGLTVGPEEQEQEPLVYFQYLLDGGACGCHYFPFG